MIGVGSQTGRFGGGGNSDAPTTTKPLSAVATGLWRLNNALNDDAVVQNDENACVANDNVVTMIPILLIRCSEARQTSPLVPPLGELDDAYVSFLILPIRSKTDM